MVGNPSHDAVTTVATQDVTVTRSLAQKDGGIVGVLSFESDHDQPVLVQVVDHFPTDLPVDEARFKPGTEPDMGDIGAERIEIEQQIEDDTVEIAFGIILEASVDTVRWESPHIQAVRPIERQFRTDDSDADRVDSPDSNGNTADGVPDDDQAAVIYRGAREGSPLEGEGDTEPSEQRVESSEQADSTATAVDDVDQQLGDGELAAAALLESLEEQTAQRDGDGPAVDERSDADSAAAETPGEHSPATAGKPERAPNDPESAPSDGDGVAGGTVEADDATPESGGKAEPTTERVAAEPSSTEDADPTESTTAPRSLELRVDRLSARVEEFGTYASALEAIIDDYGTGDELVAELDGRLETVESQLETMNEELATLREERDRSLADVREDVEQTQARIASVESEVETVSQRLLEIQEVDDRLDDLERTVQTMSGDVDSMSDTLEAIEADVESLHSFRRSLAEISHEADL